MVMTSNAGRAQNAFTVGEASTRLDVAGLGIFVGTEVNSESASGVAPVIDLVLTAADSRVAALFDLHVERLDSVFRRLD